MSADACAVWNAHVYQWSAFIERRVRSHSSRNIGSASAGPAVDARGRRSIAWVRAMSSRGENGLTM